MLSAIWTSNICYAGLRLLGVERLCATDYALCFLGTRDEKNLKK